MLSRRAYWDAVVLWIEEVHCQGLDFFGKSGRKHPHKGSSHVKPCQAGQAHRNLNHLWGSAKTQSTLNRSWQDWPVNNFDVFLIKFDQYIQSWVASSTLGFPAIKHVPKDHMYHPMLQHAGQPAATSWYQLQPRHIVCRPFPAWGIPWFSMISRICGSKPADFQSVRPWTQYFAENSEGNWTWKASTWQLQWLQFLNVFCMEDWSDWNHTGLQSAAKTPHNLRQNPCICIPGNGEFVCQVR